VLTAPGAAVAGAQEDPDAIIVSPSDGATFEVGEPVDFAGDATDPDGGTTFQFSWDFEDGNPPSANGQTVNGVTFSTPGTRTITLNVLDEQSEPGQQQITIEIEEPANQPPTATIDQPSGNVTIDAGQSVNFQGTADDPDGTIQDHTWDFSGGPGAPPDEDVEDPGNVTFPTAGAFTVTYIVTDDDDDTNPSPPQRTITVQAPDVPPTVTIDEPDNNDSFAPGEQVDFESTASDPDGGPVTYAWTFGGGSPSSSTAPDPQNVTFSAPGPHTVTVVVTDDENDTDQDQITIQITNQGPIVNIDSPVNNASFGSGVQIDFEATASDPDGGPVTYAWTFGGGSPSSSTQQDPENVTFAAPGSHTVTLVVTDNEGDTAQDQITIQINNSSPLANISNPSNGSTFAPGQQIDFTGTGSDPDGGAVSFAWTFQGGSPGTSTSQNPQNVTFTAPGPHNVTLTVTDNEGSTAQDQITIQIQNQLPNGTITSPANNTVVQPGQQVDFAGNGSDPDGGAVTFAWTFQGGTPSASSSQNPQNVTFSGGGTHLVTLTVTDNEGAADPTPATINILTNQPPNAQNDSATTSEDTQITINVRTNDNDPDGDALTVTAVTQPAGGGSVAIGSGGQNVVFTPTPNFSGSASFTYTVEDPGGLSDQATVNVAVTEVNDPPVAAPVSVTTQEDTPVTTQVRGSATDPDHRNTELGLTCQGAQNGSVDETSGTPHSCTFTPNPNFFGTARYTYTVTDPAGDSDTGTVTVTVTSVNDPPVTTNDAASTLEDVPVTTNVVQNDTDPDGTPRVQSCQNASVGSVARLDQNSCRYTPPTDFVGTATYTYTVIDGDGGSDQGQVTINVGSTQDPPVAVNDAATTPEDTPVTVNVRANDTDADGDPLTVISVTQPPAGGTAAVGAGGQNVVFTPAPDFHGTVNFTYTVGDGHANTASANVNVTITPVNDPPDAVDDGASTPEDTPVTVNVLGNDVDPDGDPLTITGVSNPTNGTAQVVVGGTGVRFTPAPGFSGTGGVSYTVSDGQGGTDTARLTVSVGAVQDAPTAVEDAATTPEDVAVTIGVLSNDIDPDNDPLHVQSVGIAANGTVAIVNDGAAVRYTPNLNFNGTDSFTYTATDGGGSSSATVTVTVTPLPDPPVANDDAAATPEQTAVTIGVMANDLDPDGDPISVTGVTAPANGTATVNENGAITYTPNGGFRGTDTFTYTLTDGTGTDTAVVTVSIEQVEVGALNVEVDAPGSAGRVDGHDVLFILRSIATQDPRADVNRDGVVDQTDVQLALGAMGAGQ
jgi:PKD repeat protein